MSQTSKEGLGHPEARSLLVATANVDRTFITDINSSFLLKSYYKELDRREATFYILLIKQSLYNTNNT